MSFLESLETDMFSLFETINSKASEMTESVKSSLNGLDSESMRDLFNETNEKVSRIFTHEPSLTDIPSSARNGSHVSLERDKLREAGCAAPNSYIYPTSSSTNLHGNLPRNDSIEEDLPSYDENMPGYAKPTAYLEEREVCRRVTVTTRKLTEADLDEMDPLYCDRETREKQGSPSRGGELEEEGMGHELVQCFREQFERLRILILETFLDMDLT
ncbi:hypothetical protein ACHWQZ_G016751 [Mnemiopsis leidyi]